MNITTNNNFKHSDIWFFYVMVIVLGVFPDVMIDSPWSINLGGLNFGIGDVLNFGVLFSFFYVMISSRTRRSLFKEKIYSILIILILLSLFTGFTKYSYRAIGELRYYIQLFTISVAFLLTSKYRIDAGNIFDIIQRTLKLLAWISVFLFLIYMFFFKHRNYDFRDLKALGTNQSFYIGALFAWLIAKPILGHEIKLIVWAEIFFLFTILILSENRTALVSILLSVLIFVFVKMRVRLYVYIILFFIVSSFVLSTTEPTIYNNLSMAYINIINPSRDPNANWRILVQIDAIEQGMRTFWFGQGLGGYFNFYVPGLPVIEAYPHSQYVLLFLTSGIISTLCAFGAIISYIIRYFYLVKKNKTIHDSPELLALAIIILAQIFYGFAYIFIPIFGLLYGWGIIASEKISNIPYYEKQAVD